MPVSLTRLLLAQASFMGFGLGFAVSSAMAADGIAVRPDTPSTYTVVMGDTLWDIAGKFLEQPWLWPQVWQGNPQIQNPDLIYPGDVVVLEYVDGAPVLRLSRADTLGLPTVKLSPEVRRTAIGGPIPAIPLDKITAYLSANYVVSHAEFENAPYVMAERFGNTIMSHGDQVFARGAWTPGLYKYDIIHNGRVLIDPDTGTEMGMEGIRVAGATIRKTNGQEAVLEIDDVSQEVRVGDRFVASKALTLDPGFMPLPPAFEVNAAIMTLGSGRDIGGLYDTLILNKGQADGIQNGQLLTVQKPEVGITDPMVPAKMFDAVKKSIGAQAGNVVTFPGENVASVLIYRVFEETSFGLIIKTSQEIRMGDRAVTP